MPNPEPASVRVGRRFLYDATLSAKGDSYCGSCHIFGDKDELAWDLGNPDDETLANPNPIPFKLPIPFLVEIGVLLDLFTAVFVMGIIIHHISREFSSISTEHLTELKE